MVLLTGTVHCTDVTKSLCAHVTCLLAAGKCIALGRQKARFKNLVFFFFFFTLAHVQNKHINFISHVGLSVSPIVWNFSENLYSEKCNK